MSNSEIPITVAMSSDIVFKTEQQGSSSVIPVALFAFIKALKAVNDKLKNMYPDSNELFRILLINDNPGSLSATIRAYGMEELITTGKEDLPDLLAQNNTHLYLTAEKTKAEEAANRGIAAATVFIPETMAMVSETELHVAFDGDAVIFSNESELVFKKKKLEGFLQHEKEKVEVPMNEGPFKAFLEALLKLKGKLQACKTCPIRTYLVTSRSAGCGGYRALNTMRTWGLEMDEAVFLAGSKKGPTLARIKPHIFFDDHIGHVKAALDVGTLACLVPHASKQQNAD